jgi:hypothetical protein
VYPDKYSFFEGLRHSSNKSQHGRTLVHLPNDHQTPNYLIGASKGCYPLLQDVTSRLQTIIMHTIANAFLFMLITAMN